MKRRINIWRVLAIAQFAAGIAVGVVAWETGFIKSPPGAQVGKPANSIMVILPYRHAETWVFDDPAAGLRQEPFVAGIPEMIDHMVRDIPDAEHGFRLLFSTGPFPGYADKLTWRRGDSSGNWYYSEQLQKDGWLCPGLFKYYRSAPREIYVKAERR